MNTRAACMFFAAISSAISLGCGSTEVHQIFMRQPSLTPHRDIEVYVTGAPPHRTYYDVAIIQAVGHGSHADVENVTHAIANRAARLGCDAVVRLHVELGVTRAHASGVCVNWAGPANVSAVPAPASPPPAAPTAAPPTTDPPAALPAPTAAPDSSGTSI